MCVDVLEAQRALDKYCDMYAAFQDTRECKLLKVGIVVILPKLYVALCLYNIANCSCLQALLDAQEEENVEAFTEAVSNELFLFRHFCTLNMLFQNK